MKTIKILTLAIAVVALFSCADPVTDSVNYAEDPGQQEQPQEDTTSTPVVDPEPVKVPKYYSIPDEFKDCEFVAFVCSGNTCKSIVRASGWDAFTDSLFVNKDQTVALVALGNGAEYSVDPQIPGQMAKSYSVIPSKKLGTPAVWSCKATPDSANAAAFEPVLRTFKMKLDVQYLPEDLDSISFSIRLNDAISPASPGIYSGTADVRYSISAVDFGKTFDFMPMQTPTKEMFLEFVLHYNNKYRNCLIHFDKRASARYDLNLKFIMDEPDPLTSPIFQLTGVDADSKELTKETEISLWDHSLTPVTGRVPNTGFKMQSGINMAFRYGSGVSWRNETEDHDLCEPSIWSDNDRYIRQYVKCGYDHFRIPIDEEALVYSDCTPRIAIMKDIKKMVDLSIELGARVIIDLHWMKLSQKYPHPASEAHFRACWRYLHECFKDYPIDMLAYEFMNEPKGNAEYWNFLLKNSIDMIRDFGGNEVNRMLVCGGILGQDVAGTDLIELPSDTDPNLILSYHDYFPTEVTFYSPGDYPLVPVNYPGQVVENPELYTPEQIDNVENPYCIYEKHHLEGIIQRAAENGKRLGVPVWVGEYGCDQWTSIEVRRRWFKDKCDLFRKYGMSFSSWFGLGVAYNDWYYVDQGILDATVVK